MFVTPTSKPPGNRLPRLITGVLGGSHTASLLRQAAISTRIVQYTPVVGIMTGARRYADGELAACRINLYVGSLDTPLLQIYRDWRQSWRSAKAIWNAPDIPTNYQPLIPRIRRQHD